MSEAIPNVPAKTKGKAKIVKLNKELKTLQIAYVPANSVKPNSYNPNRQSDHDFHLLIKSMLEDGFTQPIVLQSATNEIIDGEHRWTGWIVCEWIRRNNLNIDTDEGEAICRSLRDDRLGKLKQMPDLQLPVVKTEMTPEQMRIATLRHNRARGSEDYELTAQVLKDLRELGALDWAQDSLNMDDVELQRLLEDTSAPDALAADSYSDAWAPGEDGRDKDTGAAAASMTPQAVEEVRKTEERVAKAKTEEERIQIQKETDIYRLALVFSGQEAVDVKAALGDRPAVRLLELCRADLKNDTR